MLFKEYKTDVTVIGGELPNIKSFLNTVVYEVEKDGDKIKSVTAVQLSSENKFKFETCLKKTILQMVRRIA